MARIGLGFYLNHGLLTVAAIRKTLKSAQVEKISTHQMTATDTNSQAYAEEAGLLIRRFCQESKCKPGFVAAGVPRQDVLWNVIDMPSVDRHDLRQLMRYELELHAPVNPDETYFDALPLNHSPVTSSKSLLLISRQQSIDLYHRIAQSAGLRLDAAEPVTISKWRMLSEIFPFDPAKSIILVSFQDSDSEIIAIRHGQPMLSRIITGIDPWGRSGNSSGHEDTDTNLHQPVRALWNEIRVAMLAADQTATGTPDFQLVIWGEVPSAFQNSLEEVSGGMPVRIIDSIDNYSSLKAGELTSISLAFGIKSDDSNQMNLLPENLRTVSRNTGLTLTGILSGVFTSVLILFLVNAYLDTRLQLLSTKNDLALMQDQVNQVMDATKTYESALKNFEFFRQMGWNYPGELEILTELTRISPAADTETQKKVWLEEYSRKADQVSINGMSDSPESLVTLMEDSPFFEKVHIDGKVKGQQFSIKATVSKLESIEETAMDEDAGAAEKTPEPNETTDLSPTPEETPVPAPDNGNKGERETRARREQRSEEVSRGPAFPRSRPANPEDQSAAGGYQEERIPPPEQGPTDKSPEEMEQMKDNLFDFIQKHRDEGNIVERDRHEEVDPEEAASNFLDFLKDAAAKQSEQSQEE